MADIARIRCFALAKSIMDVNTSIKASREEIAERLAGFVSGGDPEPRLAALEIAVSECNRRNTEEHIIANSQAIVDFATSEVKDAAPTQRKKKGTRKKTVSRQP